MFPTDDEAYADFRTLNNGVFQSMLSERVKLISEKDKAADTKNNTKNDPSEPHKLNRHERSILFAVYEDPTRCITKLSSFLGLSSYLMSKKKKSLIKDGYVEQFTVNLGKQSGGTITLLAITDEGYKAIGREPKSKKLQNESWEHHWWKNQIHEFYRKKGIPSEIEKSFNGKHADVGIVWKGENVAIEVELTPKNAIQNIVKDVEAGFSRVVSCAKNKAVQNAIIKMFESYEGYADLKEKVTFRIFYEFGFVKEISRS
ncbi:hypothetical protein JCM12296A_53320 [Desulfosarcina cetonica]